MELELEKSERFYFLMTLLITPLFTIVKTRLLASKAEVEE